jgi:hypothetical protein
MSLLDDVGKVVARAADLVDDAPLTRVGNPKVPEGHKRFYRAQGPKTASAEMSDDLVGRYFTPELDSAFRYAQEQPNREILSVDVSFDEMARHGIGNDYETIMPEDIVARAQPYYSRTKAMQADAQQRSGAFLSQGHSSARQGLPVRSTQFRR